MIKWNKIFACIQTFFMLFLMVCNSGSVISNAKKSDAFPCAGHQCGCKSEFDCKTHCCCAPRQDHDKFQNNTENQKGSFQVFISSINCKMGNDLLTSINFTAKYILESKVQPLKETFLCFLLHDTSINLPEVFTSPPEKPPKFFT